MTQTQAHPNDRIRNAALHLEEVADQLTTLVDEIEAMGTVEETCTVYVGLKEAYDALDAARKRVYKQKDRMDKGIVPAKLESAGTDKVRIPGLAKSFYILPKMSASFIDKDAGFKWLQDQGAEDLIQPTVNASTLSSYVKNLINEEGIDPPEDIVKLNMYNTTGMSKYTPK